MMVSAQIAADVALSGFIGERAIIQAASGGGKSYGIRKILEATHGQLQHIVLDVEDEFFTLREGYDYALIGGDGADVSLPLNAPVKLAHQLLELQASCILQLNDLRAGQQREFIGAFVDGLLSAPRRLWHPLLIVLDEAHRYVPQGSDVASSEALKALATQGRKRGFSAIFATQRLSQIDKDVTGACQNRIMGRVDQALDRRRAADTLGFTPSSDEAKNLLSLQNGEMWFVGPSLSPQPVLSRFLKTDTTHIEPGRGNIAKPAPPERIVQLLGDLAIEGDDPDPDEDVKQAIAEAEKRGFERGEREGFDKGRKEAADDAAPERLQAERQAGFQEGLAVGLEGLERAVQDVRALSPVKQVPRPSHRTFTSTRTNHPAQGDVSDEVKGVQLDILKAISAFNSMGVAEPERELVALETGYKNVKSAGFAKALSALSANGYVEYPASGTVVLSDKGQGVIGPMPSLSGERFREKIFRHLNGVRGDMLRTLVDAWPSTMGREELASLHGYTNLKSAGFAKSLSYLFARGWAEYPDTGTVRASDRLFPEYKDR